jgi:hypothetical protein
MKWEYKILSEDYSAKLENLFDRLGDEGWELVAISVREFTEFADNIKAFFKRPIE